MAKCRIPYVSEPQFSPLTKGKMSSFQIPAGYRENECPQYDLGGATDIFKVSHTWAYFKNGIKSFIFIESPQVNLKVVQNNS